MTEKVDYNLFSYSEIQNFFPYQAQTSMKRLIFVLLTGFLLIPIASASDLKNSLANSGNQKKPSTKKQSSASLLTPKVQKKIDTGLDWLVSKQKKSGAFGSSFEVATTSLAGMALLANGSLPPDRGPYAQNISNAVDFLINNSATQSGYIYNGDGSRMHGHGFATQFLAQVYGATQGTYRPKRLRKILDKAIQLIEQSQGATGGWTYEPRSNGHEGSVTITQISALRACKNVGLTVSKETIDKSINYVIKSHVGNGGFSYRVGSTNPRPGLTGAMVSTLNYTGIYRDSTTSANQKAAQIVKKGIQRLKRKNSPKNLKTQYNGYALFYEAQAFYFAGLNEFKPWYRSFLDNILEKQSSSGHWPSDDRKTLGTAIRLIVLQLPYNYLPEMQR